jgi:purine-binding chemotaxis protein CheW
MTSVESPSTAHEEQSDDWAGLAREASRAFTADAPAEDRRELLIVRVDAGEYAIPVERIREIVRLATITRVPRTPDWLVGVVALRGEIVEVVDLRSRLGLSKGEATRANRIVVIHGDDEGVAGLLVDSVKGVLRAREREILPAQGHEFRAVVELAPSGDGFVSILDLDRVVGLQDD